MLQKVTAGPVMKWVENGKELSRSHAYAGISLVSGSSRSMALYYNDGSKTTALENIASVTSSDTAVVTVRSGGISDKGNPVYTVSAGKQGRAVLTVTYDGGKTLQIPVAVEPAIDQEEEIKSVPAFLDDYAIGFTNYLEDVALIMDGYNTYGSSSQASQETDYTNYRNLEICAGIKGFDAQGAPYYLVKENAPISVQIKKAWMQNVTGNEDVFSFRADTTCRVIDNFPEGTTGFPVYYRPGQKEAILIFAELEVTYKGETTTMVANCRAFSDVTGWERIVLDEADTVEDINALLEKLAKIEMTTAYGYDILLRNKVYEGVIRLPDDFCWSNGFEVRLHFTGVQEDGGYTVLKGGIDVNGGAIDLENINFRSRANDVSALYGGAVLNCFNCTFYGYDIACDATDGMITMTDGNVFVNNTIAARIDGAKHHSGSNLQPWLKNSFINNETAVQILSFNDHISSFNFRIYDCNFLNNGTDLDVQGEGNVYYYRNYFGHYEKKNGKVPTPGKPSPDRNNDSENLRLQEILEARSLNKLHAALVSNKPVIKVGAKTNLTTNPRWKYPVLDWWKNNVLIDDAVHGNGNSNGSGSKNLMTRTVPEPDYVNYLTSDWEMQTKIINNEADDLLLDAEAFAAEGTKEIDVVDQQSNPIGTWTFE